MKIIYISTIKHHPCFSDVISLQSPRYDIIFIILNPCDEPRYNTLSGYSEDGVKYIHLSVRKDVDFAFDLNLESVFSRFLQVWTPDIIHIQLFPGVNARSILRASSGSSARKIITLHTHALFCLSGVCFDKNQVCPLNSLEGCSCKACQSVARNKNLSLSRYNLVRERRLKEVVSLVDVIICCSHWQRKTIRRLLDSADKTVVLYYGVKIPYPRELKSTVTRSEIEAGGLDWKDFTKKMIQNGCGKQVNAETVQLPQITRRQGKKIQKVFGSDLNKLKAVITQPKRVRRKTSLPSFGYLGTMWDLKGIDILRDCVQQLRHLDFRVLMGIRFERTNAKDMAQLEDLRGYPQIRILSNIGRRDLFEKFFSQIDYLIIPSVWEETGPMTLLEAFYYKIPVIISNRPSMIEKTREGVNSLIFDNADALACIMKNIIVGRGLPLAGKSRANFPVKTFQKYGVILEKIYSGGSFTSPDEQPRPDFGPYSLVSIGSAAVGRFERGADRAFAAFEGSKRGSGASAVP